MDEVEKVREKNAKESRAEARRHAQPAHRGLRHVGKSDKKRQLKSLVG